MSLCRLPAGKLTASSNPTERARILASQLSLLHTRLSELASTPVPHDKTWTLPAVAPWATSRSAFINWAAEKQAVPKQAGSAQVGPGQLPEDVVVEKFQEEAARTGAADDAKVSLLRQRVPCSSSGHVEETGFKHAVWQLRLQLGSKLRSWGPC